MSTVGFTGSRNLAEKHRNLVESVVFSIVDDGREIAVGCANGLDRFVRESCQHSLFSVASGRFGSGRSSFARRSKAMVDYVTMSGDGSAVLGFVSSDCPAGLKPSKSWPRTGQTVSGSWSTIAYSIGQDIPVIVFTFGAVDLPHWDNGEWEGLSWFNGYRFHRTFVEGSLF